MTREGVAAETGVSEEGEPEQPEGESKVEFRKRLHSRAIEELNSNLWNFKRYYSAATFWGWVDFGTDVLTTIMGAILTYALAWRRLPLWVMVSLSLAVGTISLFKGIRRPGKRSEKLHSLGRSYQKLYDDLRDFIKLDLEDIDSEEEWLRERFEELKSRRHQLKAEAKLSGFWYKWIKWRRGEQIYQEVATTDEERELLDSSEFGDRPDSR